VVIGVLHTARLELMVVKNHTDQIQAYYLALAGVEKAKGIIWQDAKSRKRSSKNHGNETYNAPEVFKDVPLGRGQFRVFRQAAREEGSQIVYGVSDEESRLNLNTASTEELSRLDNMTPEILAAIADWRDEDQQASPGGAELEYYAALQPPRRPRNGPFQTTRELMMVRGVTPALFSVKTPTATACLIPKKTMGTNRFPRTTATVCWMEAGPTSSPSIQRLATKTRPGKTA
jgi:type II secretory pathway component PulK